MPGRVSGYGVPESGCLAAGVHPIGFGMPDVVQLTPDVLALTTRTFEERRTFPVVSSFTDTDTRQLPTRLNDNTPLRSEQAPEAR